MDKKIAPEKSGGFFEKRVRKGKLLVALTLTVMTAAQLCAIAWNLRDGFISLRGIAAAILFAALVYGAWLGKKWAIGILSAVSLAAILFGGMALFMTSGILAGLSLLFIAAGTAGFVVLTKSDEAAEFLASQRESR